MNQPNLGNGSGAGLYLSIYIIYTCTYLYRGRFGSSATVKAMCVELSRLKTRGTLLPHLHGHWDCGDGIFEFTSKYASFNGHVLNNGWSLAEDEEGEVYMAMLLQAAYTVCMGASTLTQLVWMHPLKPPWVWRKKCGMGRAWYKIGSVARADSSLAQLKQQNVSLLPLLQGSWRFEDGVFRFAGGKVYFNKGRLCGGWGFEEDSRGDIFSPKQLESGYVLSMEKSTLRTLSWHRECVKTAPLSIHLPRYSKLSMDPRWLNSLNLEPTRV